MTHTMISPRIRPLDTEAIAQARERQSQLTKPPGSLGRLEELSIQLAGILGYPLPDLRSKALIVMAADHGVAREGVSAYPAEVTPQMVLNFLGGGAAINVLARHAGAEVIVVDMGVAHEFGDQPGLLDRKIAPGTANLLEGPAMTREQAQASIEAGRQIAFDVAGRGIHLIGTGDMGIGNTTPSSAIGSALLRAPVPELVGRGTGIDDEGLQRKIAAIERALEVNIPDPSDPVDVLTKVGGFEIGGLTGVILGAAESGLPVVIDGFISGAAALLAGKLAPESVDYMIAAHQSAEFGHQHILQELGLEPLFQFEMRLGEGTGAALAMHAVEAAGLILGEMATFSEAEVSDRE